MCSNAYCLGEYICFEWECYATLMMEPEPKRRKVVDRYTKPTSPSSVRSRQCHVWFWFWVFVHLEMFCTVCILWTHVHCFFLENTHIAVWGQTTSWIIFITMRWGLPISLKLLLWFYGTRSSVVSAPSLLDWVRLQVCAHVYIHVYILYRYMINIFSLFLYNRVTYYAEFLPNKARGYCLIFLEVRMWIIITF